MSDPKPELIDDLAHNAAHNAQSCCALCGRTGLPLTRHHLIPRARHNKPRTRRQHDRHHMRRAIALLCRPCHSTVHHHLTEKQLADTYHTLDALRSRPGIARFVAWVRRQPIDRRITVRRPRV